MLRKASAVWKGSLKEGQGTVSVGSGALKDLAYDFGRRFEDKPGTNPEELIVAAHASCFAMALSATLGKDSLTPESLESKGTLTFEKTDAGFTITRIHLEIVGKVPGATNEQFQKAAEEAKRTCPISRVLNTNITLDAKLA
jgi:osmotically inducible protein OsmC